MSVTYDGTMLVSTNYVPLPKELRAEQIVADILMGTLPAEAWTTLPSGYHLEIEENRERSSTATAPKSSASRMQTAPAALGSRAQARGLGYSIGFRYLEDPAVPDSTTDKARPQTRRKHSDGLC